MRTKAALTAERGSDAHSAPRRRLSESHAPLDGVYIKVEAALARHGRALGLAADLVLQLAQHLAARPGAALLSLPARTQERTYLLKGLYLVAPPARALPPAARAVALLASEMHARPDQRSRRRNCARTTGNVSTSSLTTHTHSHGARPRLAAALKRYARCAVRNTRLARGAVSLRAHRNTYASHIHITGAPMRVFAVSNSQGEGGLNYEGVASGSCPPRPRTGRSNLQLGAARPCAPASRRPLYDATPLDAPRKRRPLRRKLRGDAPSAASSRSGHAITRTAKPSVIVKNPSRR